jgi:glycosyltransferase involved in cell wall biosynthesis
VIPTYERQQHLPALLECLRRQQWTDFEVILVDQSDSPARLEAFASALDVVYVHTDIRGATRARNVGAAHARGTVIAFTDDDCRPYSDWLLNARPYFDDGRMVGVEGFIISDKTNDPGYRTVTNAGFEGVGFMTANLLLRRETFNAIDGFDEQFDRPHFREDTDLGWRALAFGNIPFAREVCVFHPPHPRSLEREAAAARVRFFEKDALLFKKHPERYKTLFLREGHYANTDGFWEHFDRGAQKYGVNVDAFVSSLAAGQRPAKTRRQEAQ